MSLKALVLITKLNDRLHLAKVLDGPPCQAAGRTASDVTEQLKRALRDVAKHDPFLDWSNIERSELKYTDLKVRLFYRDGKRRFPASDLIKIPVRYVLGHYDDGSVQCYLPDWDSEFFCPELDELHSLLAESVRGAVASIGPEDLRRRIAPPDCHLMMLRTKEIKAVRHESANENMHLKTVARRLGERTRRERVEAALERDLIVSSLFGQITHTQHNLLVVGPTGCGKTTIIESVARLLTRQKDRFNKTGRSSTDNGHKSVDYGQDRTAQLWSTNAAKLIAGMQYLGEWEARLEAVIQDLEQCNGILVIDSLIELVRQGGADASDSLAAFMRSYMTEGRLRLVAEATPESLSAMRGLLPGFAECFQVCSFDPLSHNATRKILQKVLQEAERDDKFEVESDVAELVTRLFTRFLPYEVPPGGPLKLVRRLVRQLKISGNENRSITKALILDSFSQSTGLPEEVVRDEKCATTDELTDWFSRRVIGQPEGVDAAVRSVIRLTSGMNDPKRPIQTLMFAGPTGVGKTQLARAIADRLFSAREPASRMTRLDMSEYGGFGGVDRFLMNSSGEPAGWIQKLRVNPLAVLLFDEIEKASNEVFDCLLGSLDEGRITDRFGRTTTLCGCIIIMTSNVGASATPLSGFVANAGNQTGAQRLYSRAMRETFRPEFLNRIDRVITFQPLDQDMMQSLVRKELEDLGGRESLVSRQIQLRWSDDLVTFLARQGFDPLMGARPLQRKIEQLIVAPLAAFILQHEEVREVDLDALIAELEHHEVPANS